MQPFPPDAPRRDIPPPYEFRWTARDLVAYAVCAAIAIVFLPQSVFVLMRTLRTDFHAEDLTGVELLLIQGLMDLALVGFVVLIVKGIHRQPLLKSIRWHRTPVFTTRALMSIAALLALTVSVVSLFLPPSAPTPLERLLNSPESVLLFVIFAIGVAPLVEEIIVRGFLFEVFSDVVSARAAIPLTTLVFTGLHVLQLWGNWGAVVLIFGVGYVLGLVRYQSDSLISSWVIHATYNGMIFVFGAVLTILGQAPAR